MSQFFVLANFFEGLLDDAEALGKLFFWKLLMAAAIFFIGKKVAQLLTFAAVKMIDML